MIPGNMLEIQNTQGEGYAPLVHFESWRVARLCYCDELLPQNIRRFQKHSQSDELFFLAQGSCTLFLADGSEAPGEIYAQPMLPLTVYNIKKGTWHSHTLSPGSCVLIVENDSTCDANSPEAALTPAQRKSLLSLCPDTVPPVCSSR